MKKFSLWKLVAACALAGGGVIAACSSHTTDTAGAQFPLDRYEAAQPHGEQLLRTAQAEPYARDAGVGSGSGSGSGSAVARDAGAPKGAGDAGHGAPRTLNPSAPPNTPPAPGTPPSPGTPPDQTNPTPTPPPGAPPGH